MAVDPDIDLYYESLGTVVLLILMFVSWGVMGGVAYLKRKKARKAQADLNHVLRIEMIGRFRIRDFRRFVFEVNKLRAEKGQKPVDEQTLAKARWQTNFLVDEVERRGVPDVQLPKLKPEDLGF